MGVAGPAVASSEGVIRITTLKKAIWASIVASSASSIRISNGTAPFMSVSCSSRSEILLGDLQVDMAVVSVSSRSRVTGMTSGSAQLTVSSASSLSTTVTGSGGLSCTSSEAHISGGGHVMTYSNWGCNTSVAALSAQNTHTNEARTSSGGSESVK